MGLGRARYISILQTQRPRLATYLLICCASSSVQKIGSHYRAFKRTSSNWKGNTGNQSVVEEMEVTEEMKMWADECSKVLGGLDILGLDFLHDKKTDKFHILELNDTG